MTSRIALALLPSWLFIATACAQSPEEIYKKYLAAIDSVEIVGYNLSLHYQFVDGTTWDRKGKAVIRSTGDGSFDFYGTQEGMPTIFLMTNGIFYTIDPNAKSFSKQNVPLSTALGSPGGQMVMRDLTAVDPNTPQISIQKDNSSLVIRLSYPDRPSDGVTNSYKLIFLDRKTFLPQRTEVYMTIYDKTQSTIMVLSDIKVNDPKLKKFVSVGEQVSGMTEVTEENNKAPNLTGSMAPDFALVGFEKEEIRLRDLKGKVVLLDFWDTWCAPCIGSMRSLQEFSTKYRQSGLEVVGILTEEKNLATARKILDKRSITFTNVVGTLEVNQQYKLFAIPRYVLVDRQMRIIFDSEGFTPLLENEIQKALGLRPQTSETGFSAISDKTIKREVASFNLEHQFEVPDTILKSKVDEISLQTCTDSWITFSDKSIKVTISSQKFEPSKHKLSYDAQNFLELIDGKRFWGTDGEVPREEVKSVNVTIDKTQFLLPSSALEGIYQPNFCTKNNQKGEFLLSKVFRSTDKRRIYIYMINSDGAGGYEVTWIIQDKKYLTRAVDLGF